jgi:hypothetical protein
MLELRQALVWNTLPHEIYCIRRNTDGSLLVQGHQEKSSLIQVQPSRSNNKLKSDATNFHDAFTAKHNEDGHNEDGHNEDGHNKDGSRTMSVRHLAQRWCCTESTTKMKYDSMSQLAQACLNRSKLIILYLPLWWL